MTDKNKIHVSCIHVSCAFSGIGVDFVRSGGGMPVRTFRMTWADVEEMIITRGRDIVGAEAEALATQITVEGDKDPRDDEA